MGVWGLRWRGCQAYMTGPCAGLRVAIALQSRLGDGGQTFGLRRVWWSGLYGCTAWRVMVKPIGWTASQSTVVRPIGWTVCGCQANRLDRMMGWWSGLYGCTTWGIGGGQANRLHPAPSNPSLTSILPSETRADVVCWQEGSSGERERERR